MRVDVTGCLGCDLLTGRRESPGGVLHETAAWVVKHVVGPMNLGTLIVGSREHVVAIAELDDTAAAELGPLLRDTARVVETPAAAPPSNKEIEQLHAYYLVLLRYVE